MLYIGIDIASQKHDCCMMTEEEKILDEFSFPNNVQGFAQLLEHIEALAAREGVRIGLEATGIYGENLSAFLRQKGFELYTINPLLVKKRRSATTLRRTKTDKTDAKFLAHLLIQGDFQPDQAILYHTSELKSLTRARFHLVQTRSAAKNKANTLLTALFPEFPTFFSDTFGISACAVLKDYPSAQDVAKCTAARLTKLLKEKSRGRLGAERAKELRSAARHSVGVYSAAKALELQLLLEEIELYTKHIKRMEAEIQQLMEQSGSTITSVPGIGVVLGASILSEIGSIHRFATPAKLLAYAGLDPSIYQSGKFAPSSGTMVKHGSPYLRYALIQAARCVAYHDALFGAYMNKKLAEGKHFTVASSHVAKKLVRVIFALLKNNSSYSPDYSSTAA